ncbi:MAG: FAD-binding oxidoreductase, partial [Alphaproteobacteria bacterium]|nr:FAD-binding oxidoreductase [Alphaproteobacteria bacterium]
VTVTKLEPARNHVDVITNSGPVIRARHVICATGYEVLDILKHHDFKINSSWAIATPRQPRRLWPGKEHIWEAADPYLYIRTLPDGRVICGGEDAKFEDEDKRDALIARKSRILQRKLERLIPGIDGTPEFSWAGCFGVTPDGLPRIGPVPGMRNCYTAMCFGGNGITFAQIAAELFRNILCDREDKDSELFAL